MVKIKRIYEQPDSKDGCRVLVDRLWPRGLSKEEARLDRWLKDIAPSDALRQWYGHDPARWGEFRRRYLEELKGLDPFLEELRGLAKKGSLTLLYAAKDEERNNAAVLKELLEEAFSNEL